MSAFYDQASLVVVPSGYKSGKIYAQKPLTTDGQLTFTRASNASRIGPDGLIEKVRTNLLSYSEQFDNAYWSKADATITADATTSPTNTLTADKFVEGTSLSTHNITKFAIIPSGINTISIFAKKAERTRIAIGSASGATATAVFDLDAGVVVQSAEGIVYGGAIEALADGWYRCSVICASGPVSLGLYIVDSGTNKTYLGNGTSGLFIWGAQLEVGDIATDYIATTTTAVSVGPVSGLPRLDYLNSSCPRLLLEPQRTNLQLNSESFDNATWTKTNSVVTANQIASPDGYVNADKLDETTANNIHQLESSRTVTVAAYTMSVFAKKGERNFVRLYEDTTSNSAYFNLNTGTVGTVSGPTATAKIENYGNGWYRCSVTYTETGTFGRYRIVVANQDNETSYAGTAGYGIYIYGAQYELGAYATSYIPTLGTSVTRVADAASKTGISSLIGQTEGTIFAEINFDLGVTAFGDSRIQLSDGTTSNWIFIGLPDGQSSNLIRIYVNGPAGSLSEYSTNPVANGVNKIAFGYKSGSFVLYVNGVQAATSSTTLTMATCSRINLQGATPTAATAERTNYKQVLLFKTRLTNAQLAELTTL